jgi:4-hydroxy-3-methylbut-2-en-1-yl diphosphate reductase
MQVEIDSNSGFCFGVKNAIEKVESYLQENEILYCLGDIVHNSVEIERLKKLGLVTIDKEKFKELRDCTVLLRAHGEPPETYKIASENNIEIIDASCPVVLKLQKRITNSYLEAEKKNGQVLIYGKKGHAEIIGLLGQTLNEAILISDENDLEKIDFSKPITIYSQTTKSITGFENITNKISDRILGLGLNPDEQLTVHNTICGQVSGRNEKLKEFAKNHSVIVFVSGKTSSNGKMLFEVCKNENEQSYFITSPEELKAEWFRKTDNVGVCGATSTPLWLMEKTVEKIRKIEIY